MSTEAQILALFEEGNPVSDIDGLGMFDLDAAAYLATLTTRSSEMTQIEEETEMQEQKRVLTPWLAAAAAVILVVTLGFVLLRPADDVVTSTTTPAPTTIAEVAPTTTLPAPTTTAQVLDPIVEENLSVAAAFMAARSAGDSEGAASHAVEGQIHLGLVDSLERMDEELAWLEAVDWQIRLEGCAVTNADPENTWVECSVTHDTSWARALGLGDFPGTYLLRVNRGEHEKASFEGLTEQTVTQVEFQPMSFEFRAQVWKPLIAWIEKNHPEEADQLLFLTATGDGVLMLPGERHPRVGPDTISLWKQITQEFLAEHQSG